MQCLVCGKEITAPGHYRQPSVCPGRCRQIRNYALRKARLWQGFEKRRCETCGQEFIPKWKQATRFCSSRCRNIRNGRMKPPSQKMKKCPVCGHYGLRQNALCKQHDPTSDSWQERHLWTEERIAFLRMHYASTGATEIAQRLDLSMVKVRSKANDLGLKLSPEMRRALIHDKAAAYMIEHNPSRLPGASERLRAQSSSPDRLAKLFAGKARCMRDKPSKAEKAVGDILLALGVPFESQFLIKPKFIVDFRLGHLILQVDGDWWHGHLRFDPLTERQVKQRQRDRAQEVYLKACGFDVVRIWESEVSIDKMRSILIDHSLIAGG